MLLRAAAIVAIVASHADLVALPGGAHLLLALVGFNLARFHLTGAPRGHRARRLLRSAARVAVPSVVFLAGVTALTGAYPWATALLVNGLLGPPSWAEPAWHLWFVEALVATLLGVAALVSLPWVDRLDRRWPFWFPIALSIAALTTRYDVLEPRGGDDLHRAHVLFWLVALGWATARATTWRHRLVVSALVLATVPGFFGDPVREAVVAVGVLALVWVPCLRVPAAVARLAGLLAASSLWVYLTHWQVYPHLEQRAPLAAVLASFAVGLAAWWLVGRAGRLPAVVRRRGRARRQAVGPGGAVSASSPRSSTGRAPGTTLTATRVPTS
ncbi:hypothetical protein [Nocardioides sp. SYSU DS0663]|uniref:hypothetical protein n=1 Tax=Nocardioides sp. SYSU DS0663 TaxID=3416445 RepID=UPI003F4C53A8